MRARVAGALLLHSLTAHVMVHAETPTSISPASPERESSMAETSDGDAAEPSIIITSFRDDKVTEPVGEEWAAPLSFGPVDNAAAPRRWTDHVASDRYDSVASMAGRVKWELAGVLAYFTAINAPKLFEPTRPFHFKSEGWFGDRTASLGVDKLAHAWDSYVISELLHARLHEKTGGASGDAAAAALLAMGVMIYSEMYDGIEATSGFSLEDVAMNMSGVIFSIARNTIPGLREKLDFRLLLTPNSNLYTRSGRDHWAQQRYLVALKLSGFSGFRDSPLRFVELHAGYRVSNFSKKAIARGESPKSHLFFGVGINLGELFFKSPRSRAGQVAGTALNYLQLPYTAIHHDY